MEPGYRPGGEVVFSIRMLEGWVQGKKLLGSEPIGERKQLWASKEVGMVGGRGLDFWKWMVQRLFPSRVIDADRKAPFSPASCLRCKWQVDSHQGPVLGTLSRYYHSAAGWSSPPDTGRRKHGCFPGMMMAIPLFHLVLKDLKKKKEEENCNSNSSEWRPYLCSAHHWIASDVQHVMNV